MLAISCVKSFDDSEIQNRLNNHESRIAELERVCSQLNTNLSSLSQALGALQNNDYVSSMVPLVENGATIGYVLTFSKSGSVTLYLGKDGGIPNIGVAKDSDGLWYWTLDGSWLIDHNGKKLPADGSAPQMKTENGYWYISFDGGKSWKQIGADSRFLIESVTEDENNAYLTMSNGTVITIPKERPLSIMFDAGDLVVMSISASRDIHYTIASSLNDLNVAVVPSDDLKARVIPEEDSHKGTIHVETGETIDENTQLMVFVSDGRKTILQVIHFERQELSVNNFNEYWAYANAGEVSLSFLTNAKCRVIIPDDAQDWISESPTKAVQEQRIRLSIARNPGTDRLTKVWVETTDGRLRVEYLIHQYADPDVLAAELQQERAVLEKWYQDCNGDDWILNENWCSDEPLNKWAGVYTNYGGHVWWISLPNNKMDGNLPEEIWGLSHLEHLYIPGNNLEIRIPDDPDKLSSSFTDVVIGNFSNAVGRNRLVGGLPHSMAKFKNLISFHAPCMEIEGTIPDEIWSLPELGSLVLGYNHLEGELSPAIANAKKLWQLDLPSNRLSGPIPEAFSEMESLETVLLGNTTHLSGFDFELECNNFTRLPQSMGKLDRMYTLWMSATGLEGPLPDGFYDCDILQNIQLGTCMTTAGYKNRLGELSERWGEMPYLYCVWAYDAGFEGSIPRSLGNAKYVEQLLLSSNNLTGNLPEELADATSLTTFTAHYNRLSGEVPERIMNCEQASGWILDPQQKGYGLTFDLYESTDYSRDGMVHELQRATKGKGIDLVLLGDAFGDTELADGTYERTMRQVADLFFAQEPYASFRDYFNVYIVDVVSGNNRYAPGAKRALSTSFGSGTYISGDDAKCFEYAQKAVGEARMDEVLVVVTLNRKYYAGTCYMYHPDEGQGDYGNGPAIAYFPLGTDADMFRGLVQHEAGGHGFAKLDDEYDYGYTVNQSFVDERTKMFDWGWWPNIDFTDNPETVKWARFLSDGRYADEGLGVFEGGATYGKGVWRPTENSIMRYNTGTYNAPSREAIYKRINKLAYGAEWQYDYEAFVEQDLANRTTTKASWENWRRYDPLEKPVVTGKSWREASGAPVEEDNVPRKRSWSKTKETEVVTAYAKNVCVTMQNDVITTATSMPEENLPRNW